MGRRLSVVCRLEHVVAVHHVFTTAAPTCIARQSRTLVPNPPKKYVIYTGTFLELPTAKYPPAVAPSSSFLFVSRDFRGLFTLSSRRDHHMATDDVVREHMPYHCKEALPIIPLGQQIPGGEIGAHRGDQAKEQDPLKQALLPTSAGKKLVYH